MSDSTNVVMVEDRTDPRNAKINFSLINLLSWSIVAN